MGHSRRTPFQTPRSCKIHCFKADDLGFTVTQYMYYGIYIYNYFKTCDYGTALFVFLQTFVSQEYLNGRSNRFCESSKAERG